MKKIALSLAASTAMAGDFSLSSPQIKPDATLAEAQVFNGFGCSGGNVSPARRQPTVLSSRADELEAERAKEPGLKTTYRSKLVQAVNLDALRKQLEQVQQYVTQLEKQLPSKAEMDALLSDINQAGLGRSLQFELFRPGQVTVKQYYAELPITVRVTGSYHDVGLFAADIANLSRIVTLNNLSLAPGRDRGTLTMDGVAKTFRYLDQEEITAQQGGQPGAKK